MKKSVSAIMTTIVILLSFLGSALMTQTVGAADPSSWYKTKNGVLTSDYYSLYPYTANSIDIGISKFGELISDNGATSVGLQYPGYDVVGTYDQSLETSRDPFANEGVEKKLWLNGWVMEVRYTHRTLRDRQILAMAMFADMAVYGGDWITGFPHDDLSRSPHGGRKTTGYATTDPLLVLYDGPRRYIALSVTHIFDWNDDNDNGVVNHPDETWPVLDIRITFIFDKVSKQVIILKDIKLLMSGKELASPVDIQFSDREEWDLGPAPEWPSYAHFYHQQLTTCYGPEWHMATAILREYEYKGPGNIDSVAVTDSRDPYGPPIATGSVRVYVNGVFKEEGLDYDINYQTGAITWHIARPTSLDEVIVIYKLHKYDMTTRAPFTGVPHLYDVAQIISADVDADGDPYPQYVGWKAFWPVLSDYTVDGWTNSLKPLLNVSQPDFLAGEPDIPFTIGEWDFMLGKGYPLQFRGVEVVGLTDYHDASDTQMLGWNQLDSEVMYQLNQVFNPLDLVTAVHKPSARWVDFTTYIDGLTIYDDWNTNIENVPVVVRPDPYSNYIQIGPNEWMPDPTNWNQYDVYSERIENLDTGELLVRGLDYEIELLANGQAHIDFSWWVYGYMKILYSTMGMYSTAEDNENNALAGVPDYDMNVPISAASANDPIEFNIFTPAFGLNGDVTQEETALYYAKLKIKALNVNRQPLAPETDAVYLNGRFCGILTGTGNYGIPIVDNWTISEFNVPPNYLNPNGKQLVQIFVDCTHQALPEQITPSDSKTWPTTGAASWVVEVASGQLVFQHSLYVPGARYEWVAYGRDSASVDVGGSILVTAAFKDKQVEIGNFGLDMEFQEYGKTSVPYIMNKFTGTAPGWRPNYHDTKSRTAFVDDWCTRWPVASSSIIVEGGPLANLAALYFNDFTDGFYGINSVEDGYTPYAPWQNKLAGVTCWNKNAYAGSATIGYGLISTYLDLNGTAGFIVYGLAARDTTYTSQWFQNGGIHQLQDAPKCLTSIILKINYTDAKHPTFSIAECLGTITERQWIHGTEIKGGIHDP
ncbi:hypothetical protein MUP01_09285 [Candidatus Bathyarchaeota archaeon]|nr:hypothetical protein [Candidatus Bathyarchaeota archaeon]